jgi:hypothetical protein
LQGGAEGPGPGQPHHTRCALQLEIYPSKDGRLPPCVSAILVLDSVDATDQNCNTGAHTGSPHWLLDTTRNTLVPFPCVSSTLTQAAGRWIQKQQANSNHCGECRAHTVWHREKKTKVPAVMAAPFVLWRHVRDHVCQDVLTSTASTQCCASTTARSKWRVESGVHMMKASLCRTWRQSPRAGTGSGGCSDAIQQLNGASHKQHGTSLERTT